MDSANSFAAPQEPCKQPLGAAAMVDLCKFINITKENPQALALWNEHISESRPVIDAREIIADWHKQALPYIGTSDFSESWGDFQRAWDSVLIPYGSVLNRLIGEIDMTEPVPASLANLGYGDKAILLCRICKQLQRNAGDDPFFISSRQAGELIGLHFTDATGSDRAQVRRG